MGLLYFGACSPDLSDIFFVDATLWMSIEF